MLCGTLNGILCIQLLFYDDIRDLIHQIPVIKHHLLHLKDRGIGLADFLRGILTELP